MPTRPIRLLRILVLVAIVGGSLTGGAGRATAQDLDRDTYTDGAYGWSLSFDADVWEAEEVESDPGASLAFRGLLLTSDLGYVGLRVFEDGITDADECLADLADSITAGNHGWENVEAVADADPPETDRDAEGALYEGTFVDASDELDAVLYLECRELEDATLAIDASTAITTYDDIVPELEAVLADLDIGAASGQRDEGPPDRDDGPIENDTDAGELDGDTFSDAALGYAFTFDDRVWSAELLEGEATAGVFLTTEDESLFATATVDGALGYRGVDPEQCVADYAESVSSGDGYTPYREERDADGPEGSRGGASGVFSFTYTYEDGSEADLVAYVECRPIDGEAMVRISIQTTEESLADNVGVFQELIDGVEIDDGDDETSGDDDRSEEVSDLG